jgi:hypothetical protein
MSNIECKILKEEVGHRGLSEFVLLLDTNYLLLVRRGG